MGMRHRKGICIIYETYLWSALHRVPLYDFPSMAPTIYTLCLLCTRHNIHFVSFFSFAAVCRGEHCWWRCKYINHCGEMRIRKRFLLFPPLADGPVNIGIIIRNDGEGWKIRKQGNAACKLFFASTKLLYIRTIYYVWNEITDLCAWTRKATNITECSSFL